MHMISLAINKTSPHTEQENYNVQEFLVQQYLLFIWMDSIFMYVTSLAALIHRSKPTLSGSFYFFGLSSYSPLGCICTVYLLQSQQACFKVNEQTVFLFEFGKVYKLKLSCLVVKIHYNIKLYEFIFNNIIGKIFIFEILTILLS